MINEPTVFGYTLAEIQQMIWECKERRGDEPMIPLRVAELALKEQNELMLRTWGDVVKNLTTGRHD